MKNVMVVDDNPVHAKMAAKVVTKADPNAEVRTYTDPFLAMSDALENAPDLIVLDFMMPRIDGVQLLRELRKQGIKTKAVIVSGFTRKVSERILPENNVADIVEKPYSTQEFISKMEKILGEQPTCAES